MALQQKRTRIFVKGLGTFQVKELDPSNEAQFTSGGFVRSVAINDVHEMVDVGSDDGHLIDHKSQSRKVSGVADLWQTSIDELDLLRNAVSKLHAIRYLGQAANGTHQYWSFPVCRITPNITQEYRVGERTLPLLFAALHQAELSFPVPEYYLAERAGTMSLENLALWTDPREVLNADTVKLLDVSGFERHATLSAAGVWQNVGGVRYLLFNGTNQAADFGDILDDDAVTDWLFETWAMFLQDNSADRELVSKKSAVGNSAGFRIYRAATSRNVSFQHGSGSSNVIAAAGSLSDSTWGHIAVAIDRNGNVTVYRNGVAGTPVSIAAQATGTNADPYYFARLGSTYSNVRIGGHRVSRYPSGLPSNIATIVSNHFNAERAYYGV